MDALHTTASYLMAHPTYLLIGVAVLLGAANELINRMKWTAAESILQGGARVALLIPGVRLIPILGTVLGWCAKIDKPSDPPNPGPALALLAAGSLFLSGCASWQEITRISLTSLERSHAEAAAAAREYNIKRQAEFRERAAKVKTPLELETLEREHWDYEIKFSKVVDGFNKAWAIIAQAKVSLPLIVRGADPKERAKMTGWITEGIAFLMQGKDTLSSFGVQIGGGL